MLICQLTCSRWLISFSWFVPWCDTFQMAAAFLFFCFRENVERAAISDSSAIVSVFWLFNHRTLALLTLLRYSRLHQGWWLEVSQCFSCELYIPVEVILCEMLGIFQCLLTLFSFCSQHGIKLGYHCEYTWRGLQACRSTKFNYSSKAK